MIGECAWIVSAVSRMRGVCRGWCSRCGMAVNGVQLASARRFAGRLRRRRRRRVEVFQCAARQVASATTEVRQRVSAGGQERACAWAAGRNKGRARGSWSWAALCRCSLRLRFAVPGVPVSNCLGRLQGAACYPPPSPLAPMGTGCVAARVATARTLELCAFGTVTFQQILHFFANAVKTRGHHRATREKSVRGRRSEAMCNHAAWSTGL